MKPSPKMLKGVPSSGEHVGWWEPLTVQPSEAEHSNLLGDVVPGSRGLQSF